MLENNIFYYGGSTPLNQNWYPGGTLQYDNNLYYNFANTPSGDKNAVVVNAGTKVLEDAGSVHLQIHQVLLISKRMHLYLTVINWQKIRRQLMQVK